VPENYHPDVAYGVVLWLHEPGGFDRRALVDAWKAHCQANDLILLTPQAADPLRWLPTEVDFVRKTLDEVLSKYRVDRTRIVACGHQAGGAMALLMAFSHRSLIRAAAVSESALPGRLQVPANDPIERLAIVLAVADKSAAVQRIEEQVAELKEIKYPVTLQKHAGDPRPLDDKERAAWVRWIDTLDRL
jgi:predicted peptidase